MGEAFLCQRLSRELSGQGDSPIDAGLQSWPKLEITPGQAIRFSNGNPVIVDSKETQLVRVYEKDGKILGIAETQPDGQAHPKRLFLL